MEDALSYGSIRELLLEENLRAAGFRVYCRPYVDRIWGIWRSYSNIPKAIFYLLKGDYSFFGLQNVVALLHPAAVI